MTRLSGLLIAVASTALAGLPLDKTLVQAKDERRVVSLSACIDGLTNLRVKNGQLRWGHLTHDPPGEHVGCEGVITSVDGAPWRDWRQPFELPVDSGGKSIAFHPVKCRGNCVLVQGARADNGWEAIYQLDDWWPAGPSTYCVNILIGGPPETPAEQSVQHNEPARAEFGSRPLFAGRGGKLRDEPCGQRPISSIAAINR